MAPVERTNLVMQRLVDRGVAMDAKYGSVVAWIFMNRHGISQEVILRVLSDPISRRTSSSAPTRVGEA